MKKFIILGLVVLVTLLSAKLYKVKDPARFSSWIKIGGDFIPIWDGRSNLGHPSYWFDSSFVEHGWFNYIQIDSGGYLKLDSIELTNLIVKDTIFTDFIAPDDSTIVYIVGDFYVEDTSFFDGAVVCSNTVKVEGITTFNDVSTWMLDDTTFWTDGTTASPGADTSGCVQTGNYWTFFSDNTIWFTPNISNIQIAGGSNYKFATDTTSTVGNAVYRAKGMWALRYHLSSPNKSDTGTVYYDANDTLHIEVDDGDVVKISGIIAFTDTTRGQATFSAVCLIDTIEIAGVTTNSFVFLTVKSTTAPTSNLSWAYLNTDSITVHCLVADTALLRVNPYSWFRIE